MDCSFCPWLRPKSFTEHMMLRLKAGRATEVKTTRGATCGRAAAHDHHASRAQGQLRRGGARLISHNTPILGPVPLTS